MFIDSFIDYVTYVSDVEVCMQSMICYILRLTSGAALYSNISNWGFLWQYTEKCIFRTVARCGSAGWYSFMVLGWRRFTMFSSRSLGILGKFVSVAVGRTRWTNVVACSFLLFEFLRSLYVWTSRVYCLRYRILLCPEYRTDLRWFVKIPGIFQGVMPSVFRRSTSCVTYGIISI